MLQWSCNGKIIPFIYNRRECHEKEITQWVKMDHPCDCGGSFNQVQVNTYYVLDPTCFDLIVSQSSDDCIDITFQKHV
jgi:hypothetical protein